MYLYTYLWVYAKPLQSCPTLVTPWTVARQAPLSIGFSRQEYWSGLQCSPPDLPNPGSEPASLMSALHWQVGSSSVASPGKPHIRFLHVYNVKQMMVRSGLCKNIPTCECSVLSLCIIGWMGSFLFTKLTAKCRTHFPPEAKKGVPLPKKKKKVTRKWLLTTEVQFSSVAQSCLILCDPMTAARQASLSITRSLLKLMSIKSAMPSNHLILCRPLLLPSSIFPSIRVFSNNRGHIDKCVSWERTESNLTEY